MNTLHFIFLTIHNKIKFHITIFIICINNKNIEKFFTISYVNIISERFTPIVNMFNCKLVFIIPNILKNFIKRGKDKLEHVHNQNVVLISINFFFVHSNFLVLSTLISDII